LNSMVAVMIPYRVPADDRAFAIMRRRSGLCRADSALTRASKYLGTLSKFPSCREKDAPAAIARRAVKPQVSALCRVWTYSLCCQDVTAAAQPSSGRRGARPEQRSGSDCGGSQRFPPLVRAPKHSGSVHKTLNWSNFPPLKTGNWFERRQGAYCQIGA
jgi:hypothetical protein